MTLAQGWETKNERSLRASRVAAQGALCAQTCPGRREGVVEASLLSGTPLRYRRAPLGGSVGTVSWPTATKTLNGTLRAAFGDVAAARYVTGGRTSLNGLRLSLAA